MALPKRAAVLVSFVRIHAGNKHVRAKVSGVTDTYAITEGVYWYGLNGSSIVPADTDLGGEGSLLEQFKTDVGIDLAICHPGSKVEAAYTGKVWGKAPGNDDAIYWSDALTTIDPLWFGMAPTAGVYSDSDFPLLGTWYELSDIPASPVYVGDIQIRRDRLEERHYQRRTIAQSGAVQTALFATIQSRYLEVCAQGVPRETPDNRYHSLRRWFGVQATGLPFLYFPDVAVTGDPDAWDPDDLDETCLFGREKLVIAEQVDWTALPAYDTYQAIWHKGWMANQYVAIT